MLVDHIGYMFFPDIIWIRLIGRLSMPLFAYAIAQGFFYTKSLGKYKKRMLIFSIVSQIPYSLVMNSFKLNIGFTYLLSLLILERIIKENKSIGDYFIIVIIVVLGITIDMDYGIYGITMVCLLYYFKVKYKKETLLYLTFGALHFIYACFNIDYAIVQMFSFPSIIFMDYIDKFKKNYFDNFYRNILIKDFFYIFYPVHLFALWLIHFIL